MSRYNQSPSTQARLATRSTLASIKRPPPPPPSPNKLIAAKAETVLLAYEGFKKPEKTHRMAYMIPTDKAAWLEYLMYFVKKKMPIKYLNDLELKNIIDRSRMILERKFPPPVEHDPDLPDSVYWTEEQVAEWIEEIGYPNLKEMFLKNFINGRKLVNIDASALNQMGLQNFEQIKDVAKRIRELLRLPRPNIMRAIARRVPYEMFLKYRSKNGGTYDSLTFQKFCEENGYPYKVIHRNKLGQISCVVPSFISHEAFSESDESDSSLEGAPSVEYVVRHQLIRNQALQRIIDEVLGRVFDPNRPPTSPPRRGREDIHDIIRRILNDALLEMGFGDPSLYTRERLEFAASVAETLLKDMGHTIDVLNDINRFEEYLNDEVQMEHVKPEDVDYMRRMATDFVEEVVPIATAMTLEQFNLEDIFREQPEFHEYVQSIIDEAEAKTNELVPDAEEAVEELLEEVELKLSVMEPGEPPRLSQDLVDDLPGDVIHHQSPKAPSEAGKEET